VQNNIANTSTSFNNAITNAINGLSSVYAALSGAVFSGLIMLQGGCNDISGINAGYKIGNAISSHLFGYNNEAILFTPNNNIYT